MHSMTCILTLKIIIHMIKYFVLAFCLASTLTYDWNDVKQTVDRYHMQGAFPGGVLRVANETHTLYQYVVGHLWRNSLPLSSPPFTIDTIFDIASLTKVTATLSCIMHLYDMGTIDLTDKVTEYIPEYANSGKQSTTLSNLLLHNAGLLEDHPGPLPATKKQFMDYIYRCKPFYPIGSQYIYSDLGFVVLAEIVERVIGGPLDDYSRILLNQIGLKDTTFLPNLKELLYKIAPAEYDSIRKKTIRGEVHDPTAYLFGGVAGDAGLFSTVNDLQAYMQFHLNGGLLKNGSRLFNASTVQKFYTRVDGLPYQNRRALGWDTVPIQQFPPCGHLFSLNSFGHTGYTGTMMWGDRDRKLILVFLTNRVHPSSENILIRQARSEISDAVVRAFLNVQQEV